LKRKIPLAIVGAGPAGLAAAIEAVDQGIAVEIFEDNFIPGGQLIKQTHKFFGSKEHSCGVRGITIADKLIRECKEKNIKINTQASVTGIYGNHIGVSFVKGFCEYEVDAVIIATGASENAIKFINNDLPGIYGAGAVQTLMNVFKVKPAEKVLMIGSGNIGLIVSYQLMQAGISVEAIVEALPEIGGYLVHASKVRRLGIPIITKHTITEAIGNEDVGVTGAVIAEIDKNFNVIKGTQKKLSVDTICLAVGLTPLSDLLEQAGCEMENVSELGGYVALRDEYLKTTKDNIFVCGDVSGIEEAVTATLEGRMAGLSASLFLNPKKHDKIIVKREEIIKQLKEFRNGPFGKKAINGSEKLYKYYKEKIKYTGEKNV